MATIKRANLAEALMEAQGLSFSDSRQLVDQVVAVMSDGIAQDGQLKITNFGTFEVLSKNERLGRNPKTGEDAIIEPRKTLTFYPSKRLRDKVKQGGGEPS